jgi:hypothetical protein
MYNEGTANLSGASDFNPSPWFLVTRSLVLYVCFVDRLSFCTFSFGHYVIFPSSIYPFSNSSNSISIFASIPLLCSYILSIATRISLCRFVIF